MLHNSEFLQSFMKYYDYPEIAEKEFTHIEIRLDTEPDFGAKTDKIVNC